MLYVLITHIARYEEAGEIQGNVAATADRSTILLQEISAVESLGKNSPGR
jgi:hypothetical protein